MASVIYTTKDGDRLDNICANYYGYAIGAVEAVLVANRGLAAHGVILAAGIEITLPDLSPPQVVPSSRVWD